MPVIGVPTPLQYSLSASKASTSGSTTRTRFLTEPGATVDGVIARAGGGSGLPLSAGGLAEAGVRLIAGLMWGGMGEEMRRNGGSCWSLWSCWWSGSKNEDDRSARRRARELEEREFARVLIRVIESGLDLGQCEAA